MFSDMDDQKVQKIKDDVPTGQFRILTLQELYDLEDEENRRQRHESDEVSEERSDLESDWVHVARGNGRSAGGIEIGDQTERDAMLAESREFEGGNETVISIGIKFKIS